MNAKAKGTRLEHKTRRRLEALGYRVTRAAGSLGCWDLIAIGPDDVLLVQVKANVWPGPKERKAMEEMPACGAVVKQAWRWDDHARKPRIRFWGANEWVEW